jgi:UDP-glucose 4-epimerase
MSKVIVTGGAGFIGSNLVDTLIRFGDDVTIIDNQSSDSNEKFYWNKSAKQCTADICNYKAIRPLFEDVEYVYHLAAEARIMPTLENPVLAAKTNVVGTATVLQCAKEAGVKRVMYSSTSAAYGLAEKMPLGEDTPKDCLNPYSVTKVAGEDLCKMYTNLFGLETVCFRYFNVYGPREPIKGAYAPVTGIFIRQANAGETLTIVGNGEQRRDFIHVDDIVSANMRASLYENVVGETINVGSGQNHSIKELAEMTGKPYRFLEARAGEAKETLADITKLKKLLDLTPINKLEDYIKENLI